MSSVAPNTGGFYPTFGFGGVTSNFGGSTAYTEGVFIKTVADRNFIKMKQNRLVIHQAFGEKSATKAQRSVKSTRSIPAVGPVTQSITQTGFSYPDYVATDAATFGGPRFGPTMTAGASVIGLPVALERLNEGEVILDIDQYRGCAMLFTKEYLMSQNVGDLQSDYVQPMQYALLNDQEFYAQLAFLYTGPRTDTADDYGTKFNDSIAITNRANYAVTRTLTSIGGSSNLITPTASGTTTASGMSNTGNARFPTFNVPFLFGSTTTPITYDTIRRMSIRFRQQNVLDQIKIVLDPSGYSQVAQLPSFTYKETGGKSDYLGTGQLRAGDIMGMDVMESNVIQPMGSGSNIYYGLVGAKGCYLYNDFGAPDINVDDRLNKAERCRILSGTYKYGGVIQRPDNAGVLAYALS